MFKYLFTLFLLVCCAACSQKKSDTAAQEQTDRVIFVSIAPYRFFVERVAGPDFRIEIIVPHGSNPHSFEPTARQMASLKEGALWFRIGEPFEEKMMAVLVEQNPAMAVWDLRQSIPMISESPDHHCEHCSADHFDRHIWLSPKLAALQVEAIAQQLTALYPDKKELFAENGRALQEQLFALDSEIQARLAPLKDRAILVSHPAFAYFCKDYQLEQLSVEYEGKDPKPKHLEELVKKAIDQQTEIALALPQYNNKGAQLIAEQLHLPVRWIDPYSPLYFETMRKLSQLIVDPYMADEG